MVVSVGQGSNVATQEGVVNTGVSCLENVWSWKVNIARPEEGRQGTSTHLRLREGSLLRDSLWLVTGVVVG